MARLNTSRRDGANDRSRAQLLLIGAFGIAVFVLVIAGVVNTVTYTESLATQRGEPTAGRDVAAFQMDARNGVGGTVARVNDDNATYSEKVLQINRSIRNWSDAADRHHSREATSVNLSLVSTAEGSYIDQETVRNLTNASDTPDWTLADGVSRTRRFRLNLSRSSLTNGSCATNPCYTVVVNNSSAEWRLSVNRSSVIVDGPGARDGRCSVTKNPVVIDITAGTVNGRECSPLAYADGLSPPYELKYRNGGNATGTYRLVVDVAESAVSDDDFGTNDDPSVTPAVYAAIVRITYQTPEMYYATEIRVARGEPDE